MPLYDFLCQQCGETFEASLPIARRAERQACPGCGGRRTRKIILATPHVRLAWKAYDRNDTGSSRLAIRAANRRRPTPMDDAAGMRT